MLLGSKAAHLGEDKGIQDVALHCGRQQVRPGLQEL